jgi:hypothetical protein
MDFFPGESVRVRGWNRAYMVGTRVRVALGDGHFGHGRTSRPAEVLWGHAHVWVTSDGGPVAPWEMDRVEAT